MPPLPGKVDRALRLALWVFILALTSGHAVKLVGDPDFFWHLKTGAWIWEHKALPGEFLFSFTAPAALNEVTRFTMTSYWVPQIVTYLFFAAGGWPGILALRLALVALFLWALARRRQGDWLIFLGLLALAISAMRVYFFERPQVISFVFFALLLEQLDWLRRDAGEDNRVPPGRVIAIPLLMVAWANCHGGFVVGQGAIVLTLGAEAVKHLHPSLGPLPWKRYRPLLASGVAGLLASLANPNTWHGLRIALLPSWATSLNMEYQSTLTIFMGSGDPAILAYWSLLGLAVLGAFLTASRRDLTGLALLALTGYVSFLQLRHIGFLIVVALPIAQEALSRERVRAAGRLLVLVPAVAVGSLALRADWGRGEKLTAPFGVSATVFPVDAADFLEKAGLRGNVYNEAIWGGYLLWRLPIRIYIDGRNSDRDLHREYSMFDNGDARLSIGGRPYWKTKFLSRGIRYTVTPFFDPFTGAVLPLLDYLMPDPDWVPVFLGDNSIVFVQDTPENRPVLALYALPKERILPAMIARCDGIVRASPQYLPAQAAGRELKARLSSLAAPGGAGPP